MRTFERYLNRRRIKDPVRYFTDKGITTNAALSEWCANHDVEEPPQPLFGVPHKAPAKKSADTGNESWHVPAAERPLRKAKKKTKVATKRKATK